MKYPLFKVHVDVPAAMKNIQEVLESGFINEGEQVTQLTNEMQRYFGTRRLILTNSCTSALTMALKLCGIKGNGEESVLSTPMTCVATNCPIVTVGAHIQWVDINMTSGCMSPDDLRMKLKRDPYVKAVMCVAWAGIPPDLEQIREICNEYRVPLILDAAHAFDAKYGGRHLYEWADFTCYSFQAIKHFTTGDGGMLICADEEPWRRAKKMKWFGIDRDGTKDEKGNWKGQRWETDISEAGYKFAMNNISAALGMSQIPHIPRIMNAHRDNAEVYDGLFCTTSNRFVVPLMRPTNSDPSYWVYSMFVYDTTLIDRDRLVKDLNDRGIGAGLVHIPNDIYECFSFYKDNLPGVREFAQRQLSLPVGWWLKTEDLHHIYETVQELCLQQVE